MPTLKNINWFLKIENINKNGINLLGYTYLFKTQQHFHFFYEKKGRGREARDFLKTDYQQLIG